MPGKCRGENAAASEGLADGECRYLDAIFLASRTCPFPGAEGNAAAKRHRPRRCGEAGPRYGAAWRSGRGRGGQDRQGRGRKRRDDHPTAKEQNSTAKEQNPTAREQKKPVAGATGSGLSV